MFEKPSEFRYEQLVFCYDKAAGLKALSRFTPPPLVLVLGGCQMCSYNTEDEAVTDALRLARGMTYKAAVSGLRSSFICKAAKPMLTRSRNATVYSTNINGMRRSVIFARVLRPTVFPTALSTGPTFPSS